MRAALIPPGTLHHLRARGDMVFVYLDALGDDLAALQAIDLAAAHARLTAGGPAAMRGFGADDFCTALGVPRRGVGDARIAGVVRRLDDRPQDFPGVADAARIAGLSPSWFQALFRRAVGVPFRRYRLWRRMAVVVSATAEGQTLTRAAHEAGFASSAHLSSSFKGMFGLMPSDLAALGAEVVAAGKRPEHTAPAASGRQTDPAQRKESSASSAVGWRGGERALAR